MKNIFRLFLALFILSIAFQNAEASKSDTVWRVKNTVKEPNFTYCIKPNADGKRFDTVSWTMPKGFTLYENECFAPAPIKGVDAFVWEGSVYLPISVLNNSSNEQGTFDTVFLFKHDTIKTQVPLSKSIFKSLQIDTADGQQHLKIAIADSVPFDSCLIINLKKGFVICATMKPGEEKRFSFEDLGVDSLNDTCVLFRISPLNGTPLYMTWPTDFQTESGTTSAGKKSFAQFMSKFWWLWLIVAALLVLAIVWWLSNRKKDQNPDNPMLENLGELKERIRKLKKGQNEGLEKVMQNCLDIFEISKDKFMRNLNEIKKFLEENQTALDRLAGKQQNQNQNKVKNGNRNNETSKKKEKVEEVNIGNVIKKTKDLITAIDEFRSNLIENGNKSKFNQLYNYLKNIADNLNQKKADVAFDSAVGSEKLVNEIESTTNGFSSVLLQSLDSLTSDLDNLTTKNDANDLIERFKDLSDKIESLKGVFVDPEDLEDQVSQTQPQTLSETQVQAQTQTQTQTQPAKSEEDSTVPTLFNRFATKLDNLLSSVSEAQPEPGTVTIAETSPEEKAEAETVAVEAGAETETETKPKSEAKSEPAPLNTIGITKSQLEALKAEFTSLQSEVEQWIKMTNEAHKKELVTAVEEKVQEAEQRKDAEIRQAREEEQKIVKEKQEEIDKLQAELQKEQKNTETKVQAAKEEKQKEINKLQEDLRKEQENTKTKVQAAKEEKQKEINKLQEDLRKEKENTAKKVKEAEEKKDIVIDGLRLDQKFYTDNFTRVAFAQAYAKKLQQLFKTVAAIESKANSLMADKMDDPYYLYRAQAKYNQNMGGIKTALASEVDMMARGQLVFNDSQVTKLDKNNPEASLKKYLFNAYLEKYFNAVVVFNESLIGLPYFDQKLKENDVKEFKTLSTQLEKDAEALDVEIATVHIKDRNTFSDVTANPVDVDGFASGEIVSLENCKVWIKGGRKPDSRIKIFVQK